ncbi:DUF4926 domain-containing protein [Microcoleus sp. N3A4]|uniref:DUF4926 domain-containing protein n=1 Tax=Microcoleus sp. N3A4 TaxID=3055379 RepID=UPI002FD0F05D
MNYQLYSNVILLCNLPEEGLYAGDIGTVVEQHHVEGLETGYSVEFFDLLGNTVAVATLTWKLFAIAHKCRQTYS